MSAQRPAKPVPSRPAEAKTSPVPPNPAKRPAEAAARAPRSPGGPRQPRAPQPARLANPIPEIAFPEALPVSARREEIARALQANQVIIVSGETGSGKTTQLPKIALSIGRGPAREGKPGGGLI